MSTSAGRSKLDSRRSVIAHHYVGGCPLLDFTSYLKLSLQQCQKPASSIRGKCQKWFAAIPLLCATGSGRKLKFEEAGFGCHCTFAALFLTQKPRLMSSDLHTVSSQVTLQIPAVTVCNQCYHSLSFQAVVSGFRDHLDVAGMTSGTMKLTTDARTHA